MGDLENETGDFSDKDFEGKLHLKLSVFEWMVEISGVYFAKDEMQESHLKIKQKADASEKEANTSLGAAAAAERNFDERAAEAAYPVATPSSSKSKRETLLKEKAPMLDDAVRNTHSLERKLESVNEEDDGVDPARKRQRSSSDHGLKLMHSAIDSVRKINASKRNFESINADDVDRASVDQCKKQKTIIAKNNATKSTGFTLKKKKEATSPSSPHHRELPEEFKREIERLRGTKVTMVIEKKLTKTDLSRTQNRLSMPLNQIISIDNFLERGEKTWLKNQNSMTVQLIDPGLVQGEMTLRQWNMDKGEGVKGSIVYVLRTQWGDVARRNNLKLDDLVQVWSFRVGENIKRLYLALVLVERGGDSPDSDEVGCKSASVVDGENVTSGGSQGGTEVIEEETTGGNNGNISGGSSVTNGLDIASPSPSGSSSK